MVHRPCQYELGPVKMCLITIFSLLCPQISNGMGSVWFLISYRDTIFPSNMQKHGSGVCKRHSGLETEKRCNFGEPIVIVIEIFSNFSSKFQVLELRV